jgi:hypothetical protein
VVRVGDSHSLLHVPRECWGGVAGEVMATLMALTPLKTG